MVDMFFLALDYKEGNEAVEAAKHAEATLRQRFGVAVDRKIELKLPINLLYGFIDPELWHFCSDRYNFVDTKFYEDPQAGESSLRRISGFLPISYFTIAASMGPHMMRQYARFAREAGIEVLAATAHTHMPANDVEGTYHQPCTQAIYFLSYNSLEAGCHGIVLDGVTLGRSRAIQDLPIKKLVTGIRIRPEERRRQSRITLLDEARQLKDHIDYVVVSSGYLDRPEDLVSIFSALL